MRKMLNWYKLDNSARLYPALITRNSQSLFRISFFLEELVDADKLQLAIEETIPRFPTFKVKLRKGLFWYYFEENEAPIKVFQDDGVLLAPLKTSKINNYWFKFSYFKKKVSIDVFHALSDASGSFAFFTAIITKYFELCGKKVGKVPYLDMDSQPKPEELEDSFLKNARKFNLKNFKLKEFAGSTPLLMKGSFFRNEGYGSILGSMPIAKVKEEAKKYNTTINTFLTAVMMQSLIACCKKKYFSKNKAIVMMIPIDLRKIYKSKTLRNFVLFARVSIVPRENLTFEEIISECERQIKIGTSKETIQSQLDTTVLSSTIPLYKYLPLCLKYLTLKIGKLFVKSRQTMIFSNAGIVKFPENVDVEKVSVHVNVSKNNPVNAGVVSCGDELMVSFTRNIRETNVEREFFTRMSEKGIPVRVASNYRENYHVL